MERDNNYTKHGGVVVSFGFRTPLYTYLREEMPEAIKCIVNVQRMLPAPPPEEREPKAYFPDENVVKGVQAQKRFNEAVECCETVLKRYGLVLVMCNGGNHRAPTVAHSTKRKGRFLIHATIKNRPVVRLQLIATLVHACIECAKGPDFYSCLLRESQQVHCDTQLCVGWEAGDPDTLEIDTSVKFLRAGTDVQILEHRDGKCIVKDKNSASICTLPVTWIVPKKIYMMREI